MKMLSIMTFLAVTVAIPSFAQTMNAENTSKDTEQAYYGKEIGDYLGYNGTSLAFKGTGIWEETNEQTTCYVYFGKTVAAANDRSIIHQLTIDFEVPGESYTRGPLVWNSYRGFSAREKENKFIISDYMSNPGFGFGMGSKTVIKKKDGKVESIEVTRRLLYIPSRSKCHNLEPISYQTYVDSTSIDIYLRER